MCVENDIDDVNNTLIGWKVQWHSSEVHCQGDKQNMLPVMIYVLHLSVIHLLMLNFICAKIVTAQILD